MSDIIKLLPDHVANQIAAGEVVQRPASVVKELLENSIDAGATEIKLIVKDAGKTAIQIVDNGVGMSATDVRMAFERHATSKIDCAEDLFHIHTKGFRGEALASIAAVSHVEVKTKTSDQELGHANKDRGKHGNVPRTGFHAHRHKYCRKKPVFQYPRPAKVPKVRQCGDSAYKRRTVPCGIGTSGY